jgi:hypothetical protein
LRVMHQGYEFNTHQAWSPSIHTRASIDEVPPKPLRGGFAGCIAGAVSVSEYVDGLGATGLGKTLVSITHESSTVFTARSCGPPTALTRGAIQPHAIMFQCACDPLWTAALYGCRNQVRHVHRCCLLVQQALDAPSGASQQSDRKPLAPMEPARNRPVPSSCGAFSSRPYRSRCLAPSWCALGARARRPGWN